MNGRVSCAVVSAFVLFSVAAHAGERTYLREGWQIQSSCRVGEKGETISTIAFKPQGWIPATVPTTVLAAQIKAGVFDSVFDAKNKDPYFGMNLRQVPGTTYPIGKMFANLPMPVDSPYACSWWYRTEFGRPKTRAGSPASPQATQFWLHFAGIGFRGNVWLNGKKIADAKDVAGTWREFEFNITSDLVSGGNVLAVEVFAQEDDDLGITFVDWNPMPPDKDMGLWRPVWVEKTGPVRVRNGFVSSRISADLRTVDLSASVELTNASNHRVRGILVETVERRQTRQARKAAPIELAPRETRVVHTDLLLHLGDAQLWWPYGMGPQSLNKATFEFGAGPSAVSDAQVVPFAIRSVTSELTADGHRLFKINGKPFLVRGGGWTPDMMLRSSPERLQAEFNYVRDMGLNTIRLEGKLESDEFFETADRMGIMVMPGWCCCDHWEHWKNWKPEDYEIAAASLEDQTKRLRNHPSVLAWLYGSDNPPPPDVEKRYLAVFDKVQWPNPVLSSATAKPTSVTGPSGVKMAGPYDFVPPNYWLLDTAKYGGAYGFATEIGPGPAIPPVESLRKFLPADHLWPVDEVWNFHAGGGTFKNLDLYNRSLAARYGEPKSLRDYERKSQAAAYDGERAMFEAYTRNRYRSTGVIEWMLNNAWPSTIWHLYDYFLQPAGGYFGTKKANERVHAIYGYDDGSVTVSNMTNVAQRGLKLRARVLNFDMKTKFEREVAVNVTADATERALVIPPLPDITPVYFVDLRLVEASGREVSNNFYWLSKQPDVLQWEKSTYYHTPQSQYADLTALQSLPKVKLEVNGRVEGGTARVTVRNPSPHLAFMVRVRAVDPATGDDVLPVLWSDNYFSLLPGEKREAIATFGANALTGKKPVVKIEGWNVE